MFLGLGEAQYEVCHIVGFDHGLPCRVKNMAQGTQQTKTEAEGTGDHDQILL